MDEIYAEATDQLEQELGREPTEREIENRVRRICALNSNEAYDRFIDRYESRLMDDGT